MCYFLKRQVWIKRDCNYRMIYMSHTAHWQFLGLIGGVLAWILIMTTTGINEWRLWHVENVSVISSGVAWVGIWKACFFSHYFSSMETCQSISISDPFIPTEIPVAQVLMVLGMICGLAGNISAAMALRVAYFSLEDRSNIRLLFLLAGTLYVLTAGLCLVPLVWNMTSVLNNRTIDFPPEFNLPAAPVKQQVGSAIGVGIMLNIIQNIPLDKRFGKSFKIIFCSSFCLPPVSCSLPSTDKSV
uniref:Claudin 34 n=1 Tax=Labrus bergylta TaxID=56723 RepID=A0A3Q3GDY7_9LABR